jgi:hypothetical protein
MSTPKSVSLPIRIFGYLILALGLGGTAIYYRVTFLHGLPQDMGIVVGNGATVLLGVVTI